MYTTETTVLSLAQGVLGGFDGKACEGSFVFTALDLESWVEGCDLMGFVPHGHVRKEKGLPCCFRETLLGKPGQDLMSSAVVLGHNAFLQHVFQTEIKLHDKTWGEAFVLYILLALLYYRTYKQVYVLSRCLEGELEVHALTSG